MVKTIRVALQGEGEEGVLKMEKVVDSIPLDIVTEENLVLGLIRSLVPALVLDQGLVLILAHTRDQK